MRLSRRIRIQLVIFTIVALTALTVMGLGYAKLPSMLFGIGRYQVTVELPQSAGLYARGNVTFLGGEVGKVEDVRLTDTGAEAILSLKADQRIPGNVKAEVHSQSAVGEQYLALVPQGNGGAPALKAGDVIPVDRTSVPPDINELLGATNRGLLAIPGDNLKTTIDESYVAFGGLGPEIGRIVRGSTALAIDARQNLDDLTNLIDGAAPVLDTQTDSSDAVNAWAAHLASITRQLKDNDSGVRGILKKGPDAAEQIRQLFDKLNPTLPVVLANLVSVNQVGITYRDGLEQLLVLLPQGAGIMQAAGVANKDSKTPYKGAFLSFNLNVNVPPPCTTGFLPVQQQRGPVYEDAPDRPAGDVYCRVPQDSAFNVRGVRNTPCETKPGKRAPTVKMCESDEQYVPLNEGYAWKGDPNATLSGQSVPQDVPVSALPPAEPIPPLAVAGYDPVNGGFVGPDGRFYRQQDLAADAPVHKTWEQLLVPGQ